MLYSKTTDVVHKAYVGKHENNNWHLHKINLKKKQWHRFFSVTFFKTIYNTSFMERL